MIPDGRRRDQFGARVGSLCSRLHDSFSELLADGRGPILLAISFGWLLTLGVRLVFPAVLPTIRVDFEMSLSTAGYLLSCLWAAYALTQLPGGIAADYVGERAVLAASCGAAGVGVGCMLFIPTVELLFVATILVGIGVGMYGTTRVTALGDVFRDKRGTAMGINQASGNVGTTVLPTLAGTVAAATGWRLGFGILVPLFALALVGMWIALPKRTPKRDTPGGDASGFSPARLRYHLRSMTHPPLLVVTATMAMNAIIYQAFTGFYPTYLVEAKGFGAGTAATMLGLFFASAIVVQPVAGMVSDRFGSNTVLTGVFCVTAAVMVVLPFVDSLVPIVAISVVACLQLAVWPVANAYVVQVVPDDIKGTTVGMTRLTYLLVGTTGPTIVGRTADAGGFDGAFFLLAGIALVAVVPAVMLAPPASRAKPRP